MELVLARRCYGFVEPDGFRWPTIGMWLHGGQPIVRERDGRFMVSVEDPWNDNKPFSSCIPDGRYQLVPWSSAKYPDTWAMVNPALGIFLRQADIPAHLVGVARFSCLLHPANFEDDIEGCIGPGWNLEVAMDKVHKRNEVAAMESGPAMAVIRQLLGVGSTGHFLTIRPFQGAITGGSP